MGRGGLAGGPPTVAAVPGRAAAAAKGARLPFPFPFALLGWLLALGIILLTEAAAMTGAVVLAVGMAEGTTAFC